MRGTNSKLIRRWAYLLSPQDALNMRRILKRLWYSKTPKERSTQRKQVELWLRNYRKALSRSSTSVLDI